VESGDVVVIEADTDRGINTDDDDSRLETLLVTAPPPTDAEHEPVRRGLKRGEFDPYAAGSAVWDLFETHTLVEHRRSPNQCHDKVVHLREHQHCEWEKGLVEFSLSEGSPVKVECQFTGRSAGLQSSSRR
jgi:hypothetical protein